ncbi:MAG: ABC transporter substrate-binding protein [Clostridia bacterium]|nr:ABC transporter substrate-binding protein [Clostridia bacterium]
MKKISALILILVISVSCFTSCGEPDISKRRAGDVITLNVYNWGEYISDGSEDSYDTNKEFENYFNTVLSEKYGGIKVKVNYTTYPTNEDMYSKLESGSGSYDVIFPSDYMIEKLIAEDMIQPLNWKGLKSESNFNTIDPDYIGNPYDPNDVYSVAYTYGRTGIIYNTTMVDEEDLGSWDILWNEKYKGKILQFNNPRDAFGSAMYWKNIDVNSTNKADWDTALKLLEEQKPLLQAYVNDEIFDKMVGGSAAVAPYFAGDFVTMYWDNEDLDFYYPEEGGNIFVDAMCIPTSSKNPDIAMEYINFMLSPEAAVANALYLGYASPSLYVYNKYGEDVPSPAVYKEEYEQYNAEYSEGMDDEYVLDILYGVTGNGTYSYDPYYKNFTPEIQRHVNSLWEELKVFGTAEPWVHITSAVLVAAILILATYTVIIKKRRSRDYRMRDKALKKSKNTK